MRSTSSATRVQAAARSHASTACPSSVTVQSVKSAEKGGLANRQPRLPDDACCKLDQAARSGIVLVDTQGLGAARRHRHPCRRRSGSRRRISRCWRPCSVCFPFFGKLVSLDSAYQGPSLSPAPCAGILPDLTIDRTSSSDPIGVKGYRRSMPRFDPGWSNAPIAWLNRCRRLDQGTGRHSQPQRRSIFIKLASISTLCCSKTL